MTRKIEFRIQAQPDETTCGPSCLASVFQYYGDDIGLQEVIRNTPSLDSGGTLAVLMGEYALERGYTVRIYTYNLRVFDPTWFAPELNGAPDPNGNHDYPAGARKPVVDLVAKLESQRLSKRSVRLQAACQAYIKFIQAGGEVLMHEMNRDVIRFYLDRGTPLLTGLSSTWLYQCARQIWRTNQPDDVRGDPEGHFVVLHGYDTEPERVHIADPWLPNPFSGKEGNSCFYHVGVDRLQSAVLLGVLTYDSNLMVVEPVDKPAG